ncbi:MULTISPECIES: recombination mediator RecR [unclassified Aureispira]|uniref:recombination mediator RecR n=1 Tax=unclassified Aureispira TaxID=2649989 RepID=UPI0006977D44|nr:MULTISPECIES: recombination mediator RecR [unclassified Aureispira]WMX14260.1 recombination mediator RecR [Aureispira sp. CCB-E]
MNLSSKLLENTVEVFATLPGIGKKTALRLALHLLQTESTEVTQFCEAILNMKKHIQFCSSCHNIADDETCSICLSPKRDKTTICVVESIKEVMAIENTQQFNGVYHVLGGVISPIEGIGPNQLNIDSLLDRIEREQTKELIMAISPTIEGETTIFYISKQLKESAVKISTIARGVSFGGELEYADELTLGRSILSRVAYKK